MAFAHNWTKSPFTFTWTINNFRDEFDLADISLCSPVFTADSIDNTKWSLSLYVPGWQSMTTGHVTCVLQRERDGSRQSNIFIDFSLAIINSKESTRSVREEACRFGMSLGRSGDGSNKFRINLLQKKTFEDNLEKYVPDDTLTIRCKMWKPIGLVSRTEMCFARTIIDTEKRSFIWTIEKICSISPGENRTINVPKYNKGSSNLQLNLNLIQNCGEEYFMIQMHEVQNLKHLYCKITIQNSEGKSVRTWRKAIQNVAFVGKKCLLFQTFISVSDLIDDQKFLLTNDDLILLCDLQLSFGVAWNEIENYSQRLFNISSAANFNAPSTSSFGQSSSSSNKVMEHLFHEETFSDITLQAGNKSFPVHKSILSARSLEFKLLFIKNETRDPIRSINLSPYMNEITLRSLLLYIYTDVVEHVNFENTMELYKSANKYMITDLQDKCAQFLVDNLTKSNIFQILSLANTYQDNKMKAAAQDFISELGSDFTCSGQWQDFKKRNLELAMETMEYIVSSKRRKFV